MALITLERNAEAERARASALPSLTGLRFAAALAVFAYHLTLPQFTPFGGVVAKQAGWLFGLSGWVGVSFFFVLSGFVLTWSARPGDTPRRFVRRRLAKLFPNHLATFAVAMVLFAATTSTWRQWLPNLLLVQAWFPDPTVSFSVNVPSWSLACELLFYLCFPVLHRWIGRIDPAHLWRWAAGVTALVLAVPVVAYAVLPGGSSVPGLPVSVVQNWFVYQFPPVRMLEFVLGVLMARVVLTGRWVGITLPYAFGLLAVGYAIALRVPYLYGLSAACVIPVALLVPAAAVADVRGLPSVFRSRVMTWLGEVSFAWYLVQGIVFIYSVQLLAGHKPYSLPVGIAVSLLFTAVVLVAAKVLHVAVERPSMKLWSGSRGPAPQRDRSKKGAVAVAAARRP